MPDTTTIAARIGLWSTRHRKAAVLGWLLLTLVAFGAGSVVGTQSPDCNEGNGESGRAGALLDGAFPDEAGESIIVQAPAGGSVSDPQVRSAVTEVAAVVRRQPTARDLDVARVSQDGRSQLVSFSLAGDGETTEAAVEPIVAAVERVAREHPGVYVGQFGAASAGVALSESLAEDFERAELLSLPLTLVILLIAFGGVVAAGIPLLLALTAVATTLGLVSLISQAIPMDETVASVVLLVGLAVGVDYTLFYLRREREERRRGASEAQALATAAATSGRAVLVSGATVMIAMAGMFLGGDPTFTALGVGSILLVGIAMIGSVTVIPAVLAWLGDRVDKGPTRRRAGPSPPGSGRLPPRSASTPPTPVGWRQRPGPRT